MADQINGVAIITGGTRGIGLAIASALTRRGVRLVLNGRNADADVEKALPAYFPSIKGGSIWT